MLRLTIGILIVLALSVVAVMGLRGFDSARPPLQLFDDMVDQPRYNPQLGNPFFADGRNQRSPVANTVAFGQNSRTPQARYAIDLEQAFALKNMPLAIDRPLLLKGQKYFTTYCLPCHGAVGDGKGITTAYGMTNPPTYHSDRLRQMADGEIFRAITLGKNTMGSYADKIAPDDRWAVVAYVRLLQRSQNARLSDIPESQRSALTAP